MKSFITRTISAVIFVAIMLGALYYSSASFVFLFLCIALGTYIELIRHIGDNVHPFIRYFSIINVIIVLGITGAFFLQKISFIYFSFSIPLFIIQLFLTTYIKENSNYISLSKILFAQSYTIIPFLCFIAMAFIDGLDYYNPDIIFSFFTLIWINDAGAYLSGLVFGKTKLFERISPKKTVEGFIGGMLLAITAAYFLYRYFPNTSLDHWMIQAFLVVTFGTAGDLFESFLKRTIGIKDSGNIMPGHGGFLDRFDALMGAAPIIFVYLYLIKSF